MKETKAIVENKNDLWNRVKRWFNNYFNNKENSIKEQEKTVNINMDNENIEESINIIKENSNIIEKAKKAFENFALNENIQLEQEIYNIVEERIEANKQQIERLIELTKEETSYENILNILKEESKNINEYKKTIRMIKTEDNFLFSTYQVPLGIIGIELETTEEKIRQIFKAITTKNAIIIVEGKENIRRVDKLIMLIVKSCLTKLGMDENIVQIVSKEEISEQDKNELDMYITEKKNKIMKKETDMMYIYEQDESLKNEVEEDYKRLKFSGKKVEIIRNTYMDKAIEKINKTKSYGVSIYTKDGEIAYKFTNLVRSKNVFFNSTLLNMAETEDTQNEYFTLKNIMNKHIIGV